MSYDKAVGGPHLAGLPFPRRLGDTLRVFRVLMKWVIVAQLACAACLIVLSSVAEMPSAARDAVLVALVQLAVTVPATFFVWRILPNRITNAIYLRSFRNDTRTGRIRQSIQEGLGRKFRLSGIRDPKRRWPVFLRMIFSGIFCFRYSTTKYMSLEAGEDWFARLWRSMGDARCAFIDLSDVTDYVTEEISLSYRCLGPERILFIGDKTRTVEDWTQFVADKLGLNTSQREAIRITLWSDETKENRRSFVREVREFARNLPTCSSGQNWEAFPQARHAVMSSAKVRAEDARFWLQAVIGIGLSVLLVSLLPSLVSFQLDLPSPFKWLTSSPLILLWIWLLFSVIVYLIDCGRNLERVAVIFTFSLVTLPFVVLPLALKGARENARQSMCINNLKQIGFALQNYETKYKSLPPAFIADAEGRPIHSWRALLLPFIGQDELAEAYKLDEPWDGPNNRKLAARMPGVFGCPSDGDHKGGETSYVVVRGPGLVFDGANGTKFSEITDGLRETIAVVEVAGSGINWLEPRDLDIGSMALAINSGPSSISSHHPDITNVLFCNGSARFLMGDLRPTILKAILTRAGGETDVLETLPEARPINQAARQAQCSNNLKQITLSLSFYHDIRGSLPPAVTFDSKGRPMHSWRALILPYLDEDKLAEAYKLDEPWDGPNNRKLAARMPKVFGCPSDGDHKGDLTGAHQNLRDLEK